MFEKAEKGGSSMYLSSYSVGVCEVPSVCEPTTKVVVCASSCDVVHHECSCCPSIIAPGHSSVRGGGGRER